MTRTSGPYRRKPKPEQSAGWVFVAVMLLVWTAGVVTGMSIAGMAQ
jgi:hypothetical protein